LVLGDAGRDDWILCQITSNPYSDPLAVRLGDEHFETGSLQLVSYARPGKLFTASSTLVVSQVGKIRADALREVVDRVIQILRAGLDT
jgi:hypothetical protein